MNNSIFNIAVLIDGDNAQAKIIKEIIEEVSKYGKVTIRRIYGDWTTPQMNSWKDILNNYSISPIQKFNYTSGKNSTDTSLIIDAMDILHGSNVQGFCIVSSDSDYTGLAKRIREEGLFVMGIGRKTTPIAFVNSCEIFTFTENLIQDTIREKAEDITEIKTKEKTESKAKGKAGSKAKSKAQNKAESKAHEEAERKSQSEAEEIDTSEAKGTATSETERKSHEAENHSGEKSERKTHNRGGSKTNRNNETNSDGLNETNSNRNSEINSDGKTKAESIEYNTSTTQLNIKLIDKAFDISINEEEEAYISTVGTSLRKLDPSFDSRTYGYKTLTKLFESLDKYEVVKNLVNGLNHPLVKLK